MERIKRFALLVLMTCGGMGMASPSTAALLGDVDGDGRVTVNDVVRTARTALHLVAPFGRIAVLADVWPYPDPSVKPGEWKGGDGKITIADLGQMLRVAAGLSPPVEIGPIVYTLAGNGGISWVGLTEKAISTGFDGPSDRIPLLDPWDIAVGSRGEIYFTEVHSSRIRVLEPGGYVRTLAGGPASGFLDGPPTVARFWYPRGLCFALDGSLLIADADNHAIRQVTMDGVVTTVAGSGRVGFQDGSAHSAQFNEPMGIAVDPAGSIYVADYRNHRIRKIDPAGHVATIAGDGQKGYEDGPALESRFSFPSGVLYDPADGGLFIADSENHAIRKLTAAGEVITLAGQGIRGHRDGGKDTALLYEPYGFDLDREGRLWFADWGNESIRILHRDGRVETITGKLPHGFVDGPTSIARFRGLMTVRVGRDGEILIPDNENLRIRVLAP